MGLMMNMANKQNAKMIAKMNKKMEKKWNKLQKKWTKKGIEVPKNKVVFLCPNCGKKEIYEIVDPEEVLKITGDPQLSEWVYKYTGSKYTCPKCGVVMTNQSQKR